MTDTTIICRCEDLTLEEIRELIDKGFTTIDEIKRISRCGMGPCQGRNCRPLLMNELARATGQDIRDMPMPTFRPPAKPIKLGILVPGDHEEPHGGENA
ncbi:(2Fe-2S)-binding protein [Clostridiales bacterium PH28_bin88]|nr:(2Fe-2S)-binding protein [Clostridiales bacterium PH28_bin88]